MAPDHDSMRARGTAHRPLTANKNVHSSTHGGRVRTHNAVSLLTATRPNPFSPPTPAPTPQPLMPEPGPSSSGSTSTHLRNLPSSAIDSLLISTLPHLTHAQLVHLASILPACHKRDFLADLPPEIALHILSFVDDVGTLARAGRVSRTWRLLVNDDAPWKIMCARRGFETCESAIAEKKNDIKPLGSIFAGRRHVRDNSWEGKESTRRPTQPFQAQQSFSYRKHFKSAHLTESNWRHSGRLLRSHRSQDADVVACLAMDDQWIVVGLANSRVHVFSASTGVLARTLIGHETGVWSLWLVSKGGGGLDREHRNATSAESVWSSEPQEDNSGASTPPSLRTEVGASSPTSPISSSSGSSTSSGNLPFQSVFDSLRPLPGESNGIAAEDGDPSARQSDPCNASRGWGQANALVVSGGCDKQIRVWDIKSGYCLYVLRGHRSTVRCMKMFHGRPIAVSGGRDHTLRVWDIQKGTLLRTLEGHTDSVRCLDVFGNQVVSGSYDCTVRLWNVDTGECLRVFNGHYHQVYTVAFDGERIASGGLDTTVRIWSASTGTCLALLQGHKELVCQLQLSSRTNTVITGSVDGRIIIFSIAPADEQGVEAGYHIMARVPAHISSVTGLQFDDRPGGRWLVSGGTDGRVQLWEFAAGSNSPSRGNHGVQTLSGNSIPYGCGGEIRLVRDLTEPCEGLWKVAFRGDQAVICCLRSGRTVIEIWSFRPVEEDL
ncbi:WD40-repeat-containing domain protein [Gautieria morchelliformis]|nr:WD40-repeat-containing domain protein [Gautieria morchelliformis]